MNFRPSSNPKMRRRGVLAVALAVVGAFGLATIVQPAGAQSPSSEAGTPSGRTIVVDGTGRVSETPDRMVLNLGIETLAPRVAAALKANNEAATTVNKLLKSKGIEARDIQTSGLSIYPQFDNTGRRITGYQVTNSVVVTIRKIDTSGILIDEVAGVAGDAIRINGLSFGIGDTAKAQGRARELAVADARTQAEQLTKAAGVKLGALRTIRTSVNAGVSPQPQFRQESDAKASAPIEAGSYEVSASVQLVYEIS